MPLQPPYLGLVQCINVLDHAAGARRKQSPVTASAKLSKAAFTATVRRIPDNPGLAVAYRLIWRHRATNPLFVGPVPAGVGRLLATFPCVSGLECPSPLRADDYVGRPAPSPSLLAPPPHAGRGHPTVGVLV